MLIAEKISLAVLPEPFVTLTLNSNKNVSLLLNIQELWQALTGSGNYPMTVIVVSDKFVENHKELLPTAVAKRLLILINLPPIVQLTELSYHRMSQKDNAHEGVSKIL